MKIDEKGRRVLCACEAAFGLCPAGGGGICPFTLKPVEPDPIDGGEQTEAAEALEKQNG